MFHIQKVVLNHDRKLLASVTLDNMIKLTDVTELEGRVKDDDFDEDKYEESVK